LIHRSIRIASLVLPAIAAAATAAAATTTATAAVTTTAPVAATATATATLITVAASATAAAATIATATAAAAAIATTTTTTAATRLALLGLVDAERPTIEGLAVHALNRLGRFLGRAHRDKREAAAAAGLAVSHEVDVRDRAELLERSADAIGIGVERKISNVQTSVHLSLLRPWPYV
jgi:hypothetical protein